MPPTNPNALHRALETLRRPAEMDAAGSLRISLVQWKRLMARS
jgi:hypothetical protein